MQKDGVSVEGVDTLTNFWAPEVFLYEGTYYMAVTTTEHLLIATSDSPRGPFTTPENSSFVFEDKAIDGHFFQDDDEKVYFYYVKTGKDTELPYKSGNVIYGCEFDMTTLKPIEETNTRLVSPKLLSWESESGYVAEGPEVFKKDGRYYMLYTCNGFKYEGYAVGAATAATPLGSYTKQSEPVLIGSKEAGAVGTGHCCYTYSPDGTEMWMVYHKHAGLSQVENREICIDKITFDSNGNVHVSEAFADGKPTMTAQPYPSGAECTVKDAVLDEHFIALKSLPCVYVHMNDGSDTALGTETDPYKTLERAYDALTPNGGTIVLISSHDLSNAQSNDVYLSPEPQIAENGTYFSTPADITGPIMLRGRNPGIRLRFNYITFNSDHYIDNLMLRPNVVTPIIECAFNNVTFGENVSVSTAYAAGEPGRFPLILGGHYQGGASTSSHAKFFTPTVKTIDAVSTDRDYTITVEGGTWRSIKGGNWRHNGGAHVGSVDSCVTVNIGKNATVTPYLASGENYFVSPSGNNASMGGRFILNINGATVNSPVFAVARLGTVNSSIASEYQGFSADAEINLSGAALGMFAEGQSYAKGYIAVRQDDTSAQSLDGLFVVRIYDSNISSAAFVSAVGAANAEIYGCGLYAKRTRIWHLILYQRGRSGNCRR